MYHIYAYMHVHTYYVNACFSRYACLSTCVCIHLQLILSLPVDPVLLSLLSLPLLPLVLRLLEDLAVLRGLAVQDFPADQRVLEDPDHLYDLVDPNMNK